MLYKGLGVKQNTKEAIKYFKLSAEAGSPDGQFNYGSLHVLPEVEGIKQDYKKAHKFFTLASHQGHGASRYNLAL